MECPKIYNIDKNILHSSIPPIRTYTDKDPTIIPNIESDIVTESFTNSNKNKKTPFHLKQNPKKPVNCKPTQDYYSEKYTYGSFGRDLSWSVTGKLDTEKDLANPCLDKTDKNILNKKIFIMGSIKISILQFIILIISLIYLFNFSTVFGPSGKNIIPKCIFSLFMPIIVLLLPNIPNTLYIAYVGTLWFLHTFPLTKNSTTWIFELINRVIYIPLLRLLPQLTFLKSNFYIFHKGGETSLIKYLNP